MFRTAILFGIFVTGASFVGVASGLAGCSSSTPTSSSSSSSSSSTTSSGATPTCSCTGQTGGAAFFEVACGTTQCVGGSTYSCPTQGNLVIGARCDATDAGTDSGSTGPGCSVDTCATQAECSATDSCFTSDAGGPFCYPPSSGNTCANGTAPVTKTTPSGTTAVCVPAGCPAPDTYVPQ